MNHQRRLIAAMLVSFAAIAFISLVDMQREFEASVEALSEEQAALATAVGADFEERLAMLEEAGAPPPRDPDIPGLLGGATRLEERTMRMLLVARPHQEGVLTTDGRLIVAKELQAAIDAGATSVVLSSEVAARFGMPKRAAVAGISRIESREGPWSIVVLASGERLRELERQDQLRFFLGLGLGAGLVGGFGGIALRQQRRKLEVARELEVSALERDRDRQLARADKLATIAALSGGIAHELATPLSIIMARVEQVLPHVEGQPKAVAALNVVMEQVHRIQRVMRGFLGLARGDAPALVRTPPQAIVDSAVSLVEHRFHKAGVNLRVEVAPDLAAIACDPPLLEQALVNLLLNACDASARDSDVVVRVSQAGERVSFVVEDEGEGVTPEAAARSREPFFTTKPRGRGTGLGLAIAQEIASHHGGRLTLENRTDRPGARATIDVAST
jgi:two-component system NtrC family sensor kinase